MDLSPEQIRNIVTYMVTLIASVALHEWGHAFAATRLGDDLPRRQGRLTLNPMAHADPIGTLLLPLVSSVYAASGGGMGGFGWGKPVQTQPVRYTRRFSMATGSAIVAIAGPLMNIVLALLVAVSHVLLLKFKVIAVSHPVNGALEMAVRMNFGLFFFNLLPTPPLDGGYVVARLVPTRFRANYEKIAVYGPLVLFAFILIPTLGKVVSIPARFCTAHVYEALMMLVGR